MTTADTISWKIGRLRAQYEQHKMENAAIEAKIAALEYSRAIMNTALGRAHSLGTKASKLHVDDRWEGDLARNVETTRGATNSGMVLAESCIKQGISEIDSHIGNLRHEMHLLAKAMSAIEGSVNGLRRELAKLAEQE